MLVASEGASGVNPPNADPANDRRGPRAVVAGPGTAAAAAVNGWRAEEDLVRLLKSA
jgi:hypothetical protein